MPLSRTGTICELASNRHSTRGASQGRDKHPRRGTFSLERHYVPNRTATPVPDRVRSRLLKPHPALRGRIMSTSNRIHLRLLLCIHPSRIDTAVCRAQNHRIRPNRRQGIGSFPSLRSMASCSSSGPRCCDHSSAGPRHFRRRESSLSMSVSGCGSSSRPHSDHRSRPHASRPSRPHSRPHPGSGPGSRPSPYSSSGRKYSNHERRERLTPRQ
ncbi:hypothetical protein OH76DRAFT_940743 [Lentinus brumalis]|uniref:Uncharacterized protein n=1 Tax=Lentinus brumalis TaxID=2498619 RepID=A0A371CZE8_9APHY|nr:hypothetical protein OH76DRAFT_940743 [Polyporus brumalis]